MSPGLPLLVDVAHRPAVVVGAGPVAAGKVASLLAADADVTVVAPQATPTLRAAADTGQVTWHARSYKTGDLTGAFLVLAATADPAVNAQVAADAAAQATFCVRTDAAPGGGQSGSAALPGVVRRGDLTLAVSTAGKAPSLTRRLREELEQRYGPEYGELVDLLGELRTAPRVRSRLDDLDDEARRAVWRSLPVPDILTLLRTGDPESATELAYACLCSSSD